MKKSVHPRSPRSEPRRWSCLLLSCICGAALAGCATIAPGETSFDAAQLTADRKARAAGLPEQYERLKLDPKQVAPWEDGLRTSGGPGTYEWWYFDAHLDDKSKLVIVFYTKSFTSLGDPLTPMVTLSLDRPDGTKLSKSFAWKPEEFSASTAGCDVRIGPNRFTGDLHHYAIHVEIDDVRADVSLDGQVRPWRPGTGYMYFGDHDGKCFAWLPSVPEGEARVTIMQAGHVEQHTGSGYHDHNWGNASLLELINNWYWARAHVGDYTVVASFITAEQAFDNAAIPIFMLARKEQIIADDVRNVSFETQGTTLDRVTGKPVAGTLIYRYRLSDEEYVVTFRRQQDLVRHRFVDDVTGFKGFLARLSGFDGAYLRFGGDVQIDRLVKGAVAESVSNQALWELMYLGHFRPPRR